VNKEEKYAAKMLLVTAYLHARSNWVTWCSL